MFSELQLFQIEAIFELGDVDGDGEIELGEFIGKYGRKKYKQKTRIIFKKKCF